MEIDWYSEFKSMELAFMNKCDEYSDLCEAAGIECSNFFRTPYLTHEECVKRIKDLAHQPPKLDWITK